MFEGTDKTMTQELFTRWLMGLGATALVAIVGILWRMSRDAAVTQTTLQALQVRFGDHARYIELILERVLPHCNKPRTGEHVDI